MSRLINWSRWSSLLAAQRLRVAFSSLKNVRVRCCSRSTSMIFVHVHFLDICQRSVHTQRARSLNAMRTVWASARFSSWTQFERFVRPQYDNGSLPQRQYSSNLIVVLCAHQEVHGIIPNAVRLNVNCTKEYCPHKFIGGGGGGVGNYPHMTLYGCAARIAPFFRAARYTISPLYLRKVYNWPCFCSDIQLRNQNVKFNFVYRQQRGYIK